MIFKAKKSLGQNFLVDKNILKLIANSTKIEKNDEIIEIGPGTGNLTEFLLKKNPKKIYFIEKDENLVNLLKNKFSKNLSILNEDILKFSKKTIMGSSEVYNKFGVLPSQLVDYLAMVGDSVDNIKGVSGVGPNQCFGPHFYCSFSSPI